jgi:hypothetical protein
MNLQMTLELSPSKLRTSDLILGKLRSCGWLAPFEICEWLRIYHDIRISDSNATARIRELRAVRFGSHNIISRPRAGSAAWEYKLQ